MPDRTVRIRTLDHGIIAIPEPPWCTGHDGTLPQYRVDIFHQGLDRVLRWNGVTLGDASLVQSPFTPNKRPGVSLQ